MDRNGERHRGSATNLRRTRGVYVQVYDPNDPTERERWFWFYTTSPFRSWEEWYVYIQTMIAMYGLTLE